MSLPTPPLASSYWRLAKPSQYNVGCQSGAMAPKTAPVTISWRQRRFLQRQTMPPAGYYERSVRCEPLCIKALAVVGPNNYGHRRRHACYTSLAGDYGDQLHMRRAGVTCVQLISAQGQRQRTLWGRIFGPSKINSLIPLVGSVWKMSSRGLTAVDGKGKLRCNPRKTQKSARRFVQTTVHTFPKDAHYNNCIVYRSCAVRNQPLCCATRGATSPCV